MSAAVLVTRPHMQAQALCEAVSALGVTPVLFPALEIEPLGVQPLGGYDRVIFISVNAVQYGVVPGESLSSLVIAMGPATAEALRAVGIEAELPKPPYTTETLLQMPALDQIQGQSIAIVAGVGGRNQVQPALEQRGAKVAKLAVYRRVKPQPDLSVLPDFWSHSQRVVLATSLQSLDNIVQMISPEQHPKLYDSTLLVISERIANSPLASAFKQTLIAPEASNKGICEQLQAWYANALS